MKKEFIKDDGKIRNCTSNIAKMNILEYTWFDLTCNNILKNVFLGVIEQYIEAFKNLFQATAFMIGLIFFPIALPIKAYFSIKYAKKEMEDHKRMREGIRNGRWWIIKTEETLRLERNIWEATHKQGVFCCYEVTIGWWGKERCDYITYDTKGIWRCYEIKISKSDFHSKAHNTFIGHFNYYVLTKELYEQVKDEIPNHIGVYLGDYCAKRAKKQELGVDEQILKNSMIRSLYREVEKLIKSGNTTTVGNLNSEISRLRREYQNYRDRSTHYSNAIYTICDKYKLDYNEVRKLIRDN